VKGKIMTIQSKTKSKSLKIEIKKDKNLLEMEKAIALIFNKALEEGNKIKGFFGIIEDVQALLEAIIQGDITTAEKYVLKFIGLGGKDLFVEVGKITRKLHDSIREFQENISPRLKNLPISELPEATDKLQWVIEKTEEAASRTISLVEKHLSYQEKTSKIINQLEILFTENNLLKDLDTNGLVYLKNMNQDLPKDLTEIMIAQDFQDLTGQIIKKVIQLIADIEKQLVMILKIFGVKLESHPQSGSLSGPQIRKKETVVSGQSEVDAILNQYGF
jgi:chemotaxis regulatin CheY-phosphate phosphatase CheZ